jgi:hypothetical protein
VVARDGVRGNSGLARPHADLADDAASSVWASSRASPVTTARAARIRR